MLANGRGCGRFIFMIAAALIQTAFSKSISCHLSSPGNRKECRELQRKLKLPEWVQQLGRGDLPPDARRRRSARAPEISVSSSGRRQPHLRAMLLQDFS
jgi:hypothetical protein